MRVSLKFMLLGVIGFVFILDGFVLLIGKRGLGGLWVPQSPESSEFVRVLVVSEASESNLEQLELMLLPSFFALSRIGGSHSVHLNLLVECEDEISSSLFRAKGCSDDVSRERLSRSAHLECFFHHSPTLTQEEDRFLHSLNFLLSKWFTRIVEPKGIFDYFLRTDADAVLSDGILSIRPSWEARIGVGFGGTELTVALLEQFSNRHQLLGQRITNVNMQSTFYVRQDSFLAFVRRINWAARVLRREMFTTAFCKRLEHTRAAKILAKGKKNLCRWPYWHKEVATLYGTIIAAHTTLSSFETTETLDALAAPISKHYMTDPNEIIQAHLIPHKHYIPELIASGIAKFCQNRNDAIFAALSALPNFRQVALLFEAASELESGFAIPSKSIHHLCASIIMNALEEKHCSPTE